MSKAPYALLALAPLTLAAQPAKRAITFADFTAVKAVTDPQVSPDGRMVLYAMRTTDVGANRRMTTTWIMPSNGGAARQFPGADVAAAEARWSPDGRWVTYTAAGQLWLVDVQGGVPRQL